MTSHPAQQQLSISPNKWADAWWTQIFSIIATYPSENPSNLVKEDTRVIFIAMRSTLPCEVCRRNWEIKLQKSPLTDTIMNRQKTLLAWMCDRFREINITKSHWSNTRIATHYISPLFSPNSNNTFSHDISANSKNSDI